MADDDGGEGCAEFTVSGFVPNRPPVCVDARSSVGEIWPPNHDFVPVEVQGVTDPEGGDMEITVTGITQDEPVDTTGDGQFVPDAEGVGSATAEVRAERTGTPELPGNGRVYHVGFTAEDRDGASCDGEVVLAVPHDRNTPAVDDGPRYDSTATETRRAAEVIDSEAATDASAEPANRPAAASTPKGSKKINLTVPEVTTQSLDATTLQAQVAGGKRGTFRVVFEIRPVGGGEWATLATDRTAPFRKTVDLTELEPGAYEVRAVANGKGKGRYTSRSHEITIPDAGSAEQPLGPDEPTDGAGQQGPEDDPSQQERERETGTGDESLDLDVDRQTPESEAAGSDEAAAPETITDSQDQGEDRPTRRQNRKHKA